MDSRIITLFGDEDKAPESTAGVRPKKSVESKTPLALQPEWTAEKAYYTIGEVALLFGLAASAVRFWTKEFGINVRTTPKGDRLYTPKNITELRAINHLVKERGFTIAGAKAKLKEGVNTGPVAEGARKKSRTSSKVNLPHTAAMDLRASLLGLRATLLAIRNSLS
jgi:DNA-binding transcriptional MerR regulator